MALSDDLRKRVAPAVVSGGLSRDAAAKRFDVGIASAARRVKQFATTLFARPPGDDQRSAAAPSSRKSSPQVSDIRAAARIASLCYDLPMIRFGLSLLAFLTLVAPAVAAAAKPCQDMEEQGASYTVCIFDARADSIRLFLADEKNEVYGSFSTLSAALARKGETLAFAMNAGMYDEAHRPIGLFIEDGSLEKKANTRSGAGNFHMKPNGVFWAQGARAGVTETQRFVKERLRPAYATQSGPMLVVGGRINPRIHETGTSEKIRNGVGVRDGHIVAFAISNRPVTFHAFASLFRERLKCLDALFLDGSISALYAPSLGRHDHFRPMGPIVGVVEKVR